MDKYKMSKEWLKEFKPVHNQLVAMDGSVLQIMSLFDAVKNGRTQEFVQYFVWCDVPVNTIHKNY